MRKREINKNIVTEIHNKLEVMGLADKMEVFPVENTFTRRQRYWMHGDKAIFKIHMWDLNSLPADQCSKEIEQRIEEARKYFGF